MSNVVFGIKITTAGVQPAVTDIQGVGRALEGVGQQATASFGKTRQGLESISSQLKTLENYAKAWLGVSQLASLTRSIIQTADEYTALQARLKLATTSQVEFNAASAALFAVAQRNAVPMAETVSLYNKLAPALRELGGTQQQTLLMTDLVGKSLRISGAGAQESAVAMLQFAQAMGSGVLRGDEFNSLMEASPRLMKAVADGLHKPVGALRSMAEQGQLTAESVANALMSQNATLSNEMAKMPLTVSAAWVKLGNAVTQEIGRIDASLGSSAGIAKALDTLTGNVKVLEDAFVSAAKVGVAAFSASLITARAEAIATAGLAGIGALRNAVAGLVLLYESGGLALLASGVLGIGAAARATTPAVLTLGGALKALVWPVALGYALYEFADYAQRNFLAVRLSIVALAETFQKGVAIVSHPLDKAARDQAIAQIKADNAAIAAALIAENQPIAPPKPKDAGRLMGAQIAQKEVGAKSGNKADPYAGVASALDAIRMDAVKAQIASYGMAAEQVKVYELALKGSNEVEKLAANGHLKEAAALRVKVDAAVEEAQAAATQQIALAEEAKAYEKRQAALADSGKGVHEFVVAANLENEAVKEQIALLGKGELAAKQFALAKKFAGQLAKSLNTLGVANADEVAAGLSRSATPEQAKSAVAGIADAGVRAAALKYWADLRVAQKAAAETAQGAFVAERDALTGFNSAVQGYLDQINNHAQAVNSLVTNSFKGMEDALVKFVRTGKLDFASLADSIINDLMRIQIRQSLMQPLAEAMGGSGGIMGIIGGLLGGGGSAAPAVAAPAVSQYSLSSGGSSFGLAGARAAGGPVAAGSAYLVGEQGAEIFTPSVSGNITPNHRINSKLAALPLAAANGGAVTVNVINNASGTQATAQSRSDGNGGMMIDVVVEQIEAGLARNVSRGTGSLNNALTQTFGLNRAAGAF